MYGAGEGVAVTYEQLKKRIEELRSAGGCDRGYHYATSLHAVDLARLNERFDALLQILGEKWKD